MIRRSRRTRRRISGSPSRLPSPASARWRRASTSSTSGMSSTRSGTARASACSRRSSGPVARFTADSRRNSRKTRKGASPMQDLQGFVAALRVGGAMIYPLLLLAVVAVVVILEKAFVFSTRTRLPAPVLEVLETYAFAWNDLEQRVGQMDARNYFRRFFRVILDQRARPAWWVESRAAEEATLIERALGRWLWALETIVTAAPLLGLLGTITGMIRAFHLFGAEGLVDPRGVTGGVAEALIATAVGLFIALIALFAFNYFSHRLAEVMDEMEQLGTRVVDSIRLEEKGGAP